MYLNLYNRSFTYMSLKYYEANKSLYNYFLIANFFNFVRQSYY
jgi:hypothetical protein